MNTILAVINNWPCAERILTKASQIAKASGAGVFVYCPVSSPVEELNRYIGFDNYQEVRAALLDENQTRLDNLRGVDAFDSLVEWQSKPYRAVADKAEALSATMIVMAASTHRVLGDFLHKPDDWHLLREARCPVLILGSEAREYRAVAVAVDALDDSDDNQSLMARVLDEAEMMAEVLRLPLRVISVAPDPGYAYSDILAADVRVLADFRIQSENMTRQRQQQVLARYGVQAQKAEVVSGGVEKILQQAAAEAGLLVIGTIANKGLRGFFLGNTAERLLQHLEGDMLVVD